MKSCIAGIQLFYKTGWRNGLFAPYRQDIAIRVGKLESAATGKGEDLPGNPAAGFFYLFQHLLQLGAVQHYQRIRGFYPFPFGNKKTAIGLTVCKGGILRTIIGELPAENLTVKVLMLLMFLQANSI